MDLYSTKVRLAGNPLNEVRKENCTAAEIICLQTIHGSDSVLNIERTSAEQRNVLEERERLQTTYGQGLQANKSSLLALFGPEHAALPTKLAGYDADDVDDGPEDKTATRRRTKQRGSAIADFEEQDGAALMA